MAVWQNISNATLLLPREDGLKPDIELLPERTFQGSTFFYQQYSTGNDPVIQRITDGYLANSATVSTGPDRLQVGFEGFIDEDAMVASAADAAVNATVAASTGYSVFGDITWTEGATEYTCFFSIVGNGTHGAGSTFVIGAITPGGSTSGPVTALSSIDVGNGLVTFALAGAIMFNPVINVHYEPQKPGFRYGRSVDNPLLTSPMFTTIRTVNANSQVTYEKRFYTGSKVGDYAVETIRSFTGAQTQPDTEVMSISEVTQADLNALP